MMKHYNILSYCFYCLIYLTVLMTRAQQVAPSGWVRTNNYHVETLAGDTNQCTNYIPQWKSRVGKPVGIFWVPSTQELYFTDLERNSISKITSSGQLVDLIGGSESRRGYAGDGFLAINSKINGSTSVIVDSSNGDVYFTDDWNHRIRKISASSGIVSTIAGTGTKGYNMNNGNALSIHLNVPRSIKFSSSSTIVFLDYGNCMVRELNLISGQIRKLFSSPFSCTGSRTDPVGYSSRIFPSTTGDIYLSDDIKYQVSVLQQKDGKQKNFAGAKGSGYTADGEKISDERMSIPTGLYLNAAETTCYIVESGNHLVRYATGDKIYTIAGTAMTSGFSGDGGNALHATLNSPSDLFFDETNSIFLISDTNNGRIRNVSGGIINSKMLYSNAVPSVSTTFASVVGGFTFGSDGTLFVSESEYSTIRYGNSSFSILAGTGLSGYSGNEYFTHSSMFNSPKRIAFNSRNELFVVDANNHRIRKIVDGMVYDYAGSGSVTGSDNDWGLALNSIIINPMSLFILPNDDMLIASTGKISKVFSNNGTILTLYRHPGVVISDLCINFNNFDIYFSELSTHTVRKLDSNGNVSIIAGNGFNNIFSENGLATSVSIDSPSSILITQNNELIIAEKSRIRRVTLIDNIISTITVIDKTTQTNTTLINQAKSLYLNNNGDILYAEGCSIKKITQILQPLYPLSCYGILANSSFACSGNGICNSTNECTCNEGFSGSLCEEHSCFGVQFNSSSVCSGNGICTEINNCTCFNGFSGFNCQDVIDVPLELNNYSCFSVNSNDSNVCSGVGICISMDNCTCSFGYSGSNCEISPIPPLDCFGVLNGSETVCSGHGQCVSKDNCKCFDGFYGLNCELVVINPPTIDFTCFGISFNHSTVCNGNGICNSTNECLCNEGFTGLECETEYHYCFGVFLSDPNVCGQHGECISRDTCQCQNGYVGSDCSVPVCFELLSSDLNVCSGNGKCMAPDSCVCGEGWLGKNCSTRVCLSVVDSESGNVTCSNNPSDDVELVKKKVTDLSELNAEELRFQKYSSVSVKFPSDMSSLKNSSDLTIIATVQNKKSANQKVGYITSDVVSVSFLKDDGSKFIVSNLANPIIIHFGNLTLDVEFYEGISNFTCMFFDPESKVWSNTGVLTIVSSIEQVSNKKFSVSIQCHTSHLTTFSVIDTNFRNEVVLPKQDQTSNDSSVVIAVLVSVVASSLIFFVVGIVIGISVALLYRKKNKGKDCSASSSSTTV